MMKKFMFVISLCIALVCSGCGKSGNSDNMEAQKGIEGKEGASIYEESEREDSMETYEDIADFFDAITDEMLNACDEYPSLEEYENDSLVLLEQFQDVRLYGIRAGEETAMLLYIEGEKVLIEEDPFPSFLNLYQERPRLNVFDVDSDGADEVMISVRTVTGAVRRYAMLVCDREDEWNIYMYDDYLKDIEDLIKYEYDDKNNVVIFLDNKGNVLWEAELPEWADAYPYAGAVNFEDDMGVDVETIRQDFKHSKNELRHKYGFEPYTIQMDVVPQIEMENSLPYIPIKIVFNVSFIDGDFEIAGYEIQKNDSETESYIKEHVVLEDDTEIESYEWMQYDRNPVLHVNIQYKEQPENAYRHKEDYFLFMTQDDEISQVLVIDYEDKGIHIGLNEETECEGNHSLGEGCGFDAHFEDVTFDGRKDLIISVGNSRHAAYYCAYICEDDGFRYEKTFEHIPSYKVKRDEKVIHGSDTDGMGWSADMTYEYKDGKFLLTDCVEKEILE